MLDQALEWIGRILEWFSRNWKRLLRFYHPRTWREKGLLWSLLLLVATYLLVTLVLGWYWSIPPDQFDVRQPGGNVTKQSPAPVTGTVYTGTLISIADTLLNKPGGYLANDKTPPGVWLDNMPNWEFGALVMLRDGVAAMRDHFSRSQTQSVEDKDLAEAQPQFNFQNDSWILPSTEGEYRQGVEALQRYFSRLSRTDQQQAHFFARADNLRLYLEIVEKRLGSLSQRLSASVGQTRINTDLANDPDARQAARSDGQMLIKTPWRELDDVFYEARGATWALLHILRAVEQDFSSVLDKKNARVSLRQIIRELEATQQPTFSPVILNGSGFGIFANYSLTMANYIARANAAVIDLRELLQRG